MEWILICILGAQPSHLVDFLLLVFPFLNELCGWAVEVWRSGILPWLVVSDLYSYYSFKKSFILKSHFHTILRLIGFKCHQSGLCVPPLPLPFPFHKWSFYFKSQMDCDTVFLLGTLRQYHTSGKTGIFLCTSGVSGEWMEVLKETVDSCWEARWNTTQ